LGHDELLPEFCGDLSSMLKHDEKNGARKSYRSASGKDKTARECFILRTVGGGPSTARIDGFITPDHRKEKALVE
jgi:hypothetical protein